LVERARPEPAARQQNVVLLSVEVEEQPVRCVGYIEQLRAGHRRILRRAISLDELAWRGGDDDARRSGGTHIGFQQIHLSAFQRLPLGIVERAGSDLCVGPRPFQRARLHPAAAYIEEIAI
jgi:hypothetical protein